MPRHYSANGYRSRYAIAHVFCLLFFIASVAFSQQQKVPRPPDVEPFSKPKLVQTKRPYQVHRSELRMAEFGVLRVTDDGKLRVSVPEIVDAEVEVIEKDGLYLPVVPDSTTEPTKTIVVEQLQLVQLKLRGCRLRRVGDNKPVLVESLPKEDVPVLLAHETDSLTDFYRRLLRPDSLVLLVPKQKGGQR